MSVNRFMAYGYDVDECGNMVGIEDYRKLQAENAALKEENETSKSMIQNLASYAEGLEKKFAAQANSHATMVGSMILTGDNNKIGAVSSDISQTINGFSQFRFRQDDGKEFVVMFKVSQVANTLEMADEKY